MKLEVFDGADGCDQLDTVRALYGEIYADPPQSKGPEDVAKFADDWPRRCSAPGFRLVIARDDDGTPFGFTFGHQLAENTGWWAGLRVTPPPHLTEEWPGRTFAIIEMMVRKDRRRAGVARAMHDALLAGRTEERVTLLVRPGPLSAPAQEAYRSWGFQVIGPLQPFDGAPVYDAMWRRLPLSD